MAAENACGDIIKVLLDRGADIEAKDMFGRTPLIMATEMGHTRIVEVLPGKGADFEWKNSCGQTALS